MFLKQNLDDSNIKLLPFTTAVVVTYMGKMMIHPHCDQRYSPKGNFLDCQNSQEEDTATVILVIGDTRYLEFELYHRTSIQEKVKPKVGGHFIFKHGSLFILHPRDEKPTIRYGLEKYGRTFFKHSCKGVESVENGLSIGIVFRTTKHLAEVNSDTGCVVLNNNLDINIIGIESDKKPKKDTKKESERRVFFNRDKMIESYWSGQKEVDELHIKSLWKKRKEKHFW